jgi:NAD(P)-dependent dehydrogenase (short-subunit alcohol dehydrogenase family)
MDLGLREQVVLVTGSSSGIGRAAGLWCTARRIPVALLSQLAG